MRYLIAAIFALFATGCAADRPVTSLPTGSEAYSVIPAETHASQIAVGDYKIGPLDTVDVAVYGEPDLSAKALQVDASGQIALPLVGTVDAKGKSAAELSTDLEKILGARYLKDPKVTVTVAASVSQKVSIEGEVAEPGVYPMTGPTTLLGVIAMAKGETDVATLQQVVVFRTINGERMGAVFDVASIRRGAAPDPVMQGNDMVVVGYSSAKRFWKNVISAAPMFSIFRPITF
ncbi:MAG TPA: polysaccharide biosynthesis/export family protein [Sphingomicrobium sp.]